MTRKEYELIFLAFKNYRCFMTQEEEVLSEKILDSLFYPEFDKLSSDISPCAGVEDEIKSLNFR